MNRESLVQQLLDAGARKSFDNSVVQEYTFRPKPKKGEVVGQIVISERGFEDRTEHNDYDWPMQHWFSTVDAATIKKIIARCQQLAKRPITKDEIDE